MFKTKGKSIAFATLFGYILNTAKRVIMSFSYKPLWKLLIDKEMSKKQFMLATGISKSTMDKMGRREAVSMDIIDRICTFFSCNVEDVISHDVEGGENEKKGFCEYSPFLW